MICFSDEQVFDPIPAPETVGEDAAKKSDGRFGGMFKTRAKYDNHFKV